MSSISLAFVSIPAFLVMIQQNVPRLVWQNADYQLPVLASFVLGVVGSAVATLLFYVLIKRAGAVFASLVTYGIPIVAILWGIAFEEQVTLLQVGCLAIILGGVYLANRN